MRILFALPGLHRYDRGAEVAFISIAEELAKAGDMVTLSSVLGPPADRPVIRICARQVFVAYTSNFSSIDAYPTK